MRNPTMAHSTEIFLDRVCDILRDNAPSVLLFGSAATDDFRLGWSDIDLICVTENPIMPTQAEMLVNVRQTLVSEYRGNPYFRLFEGGAFPKSVILGGNDTTVYWGTSGQRVTDRFALDPFARIEIAEHGRTLRGGDIRGLIPRPTEREIADAVRRHYDTIRKYGRPDASVHGAGWILDIARCLYTLRTLDVIAKTSAGEWALREHLSPDDGVLRRVVEIRKNPLKFVKDADTLQWIATLGAFTQSFADVLEIEMERFS